MVSALILQRAEKSNYQISARWRLLRNGTEFRILRVRAVRGTASE